MNSNQKEKILKAIKLGVNKFELIDAFDLEKDDLKELNDFYDIALKVKKSIESNNNFLTELYASEVDEEDYNLILNFFNKKKVFVKQKKLQINIKKGVKIILKNIGILIVLIFLTIILFFIFSNFFQIDFNFGNLDFSSINFNPLNIFLPNNQKEIIISGLIIGELTDFSKTKISVNGANLSSFDFNKNNFEIKVKCVDDFVIDFSLADFVPIHKQIDFCVNQKIGIFMTKISKFENIDLTKKNIVSNNSVSVDLNGADLVIFGKNISPKDAKISVTGFNPNNVEDLKYFPGELEGIDENGVKTSFVSFGFAKILATDSKGNKLDFKNENARISFSIDPIHADLAPTKAILWNYNEKKGIWEYVGVAIKNCDTKCVYDANLTKIGSWFSVGSKTTSQVNIAINGFDFSATNNRVDVAVAPTIVPSGTPTVNLNPNEKIENLSEIKTDMVCTKEEISGYDRKKIGDAYNDTVMDFVLTSNSKTLYIGKGVAQVVKDAEGNIVREIETDCTCTEDISTENRYLYDCDGYNENGYYDWCTRKWVSFSCAGAKVENAVNPYCKNYNDLENKIYEIYLNAYRDSILKYSTQFHIDPRLVAAIALVEVNNQFRDEYSNILHSRDAGGGFFSNLKKTIENGLGDIELKLKACLSDRSDLDIGNMHIPFEIAYIIFGADEKKASIILDTWNYPENIVNYKHLLESEPGFKELIESKISEKDFAKLYSSSNPVNLDGQVLVLTAYLAAQDQLWLNNPKSDFQRLSEQNLEAFGHLYNIGWKHFNPKENPKAVKMSSSSFSTIVDGEAYKTPQSFGKRFEMFYNSEKMAYFFSNDWNGMMPDFWGCGDGEDNLKKIRFAVEEVNSFNEWLNSVQPAKINLNNISGNFVLGVNKGNDDISIYDGVDLISGQIFYPINDFVYYSEVPSITEKLFGDLVVYDSFIVDQGGGYSIGNNDGLFKLANNSIIQKSGEKLIIQNGDSIFDFGEKVGNIYFITKSKSSNIKSEINYSYENGLLKEIDFGDSKTTFNYAGNTLENVVYESSGNDVLTEEFDYLENKLSQILYKVNGEIISDINYIKNQNYFEVKNSLYSQKFNLINNQVTKIENSSFDSNGDLVTINTDFEYSKYYTYITSDGYTNTCFMGICFIDELLNSITTSAKCVDYYSDSAQVNDFDKFVLVINGLDENKNNFVIREDVDKSKISNMVSVKVPINSDLNLFLELNGVPSDPIITELGNDSINVSDLLDSPKNCSNTMISFGGFSLDNCAVYAQDENKLINCLLGSVGMFDTNTSDLINFISGLDTNNALKETVISFIENRFK
ncbi:MAG: hypothetical protein PHX27_01635 [Candidatus ainarchaeum sp.]|nr:hypothetical protein [Candidatus ainarchaeum sp.]